MKKCIVNLGIILSLVYPSMLHAQITAQSFQPEFLSCEDAWNPPYVIANSNCGNITLDYVVFEDGSGCSVFRTVITTILDECNNILTLTHVTEIVDDQAPQFINPPVDITLNCEAELPPVANIQAIDNCDAEVDMTYEELTFDDGCQHYILRVFSAADDCGNSSNYIQTITAVDIDAPQIEIEDVVYSPNEIPDPQLLATISDNCSQVAVSFDVIGPQPDPVYGAQYLYVYTAVDDCGNIAYKFHEVYTCDRTTIMISHLQGQSLAGLSYTITNNAGEIVASGSAGNSSFYEDASCLGAGCYTVEVQNPLNYPISWTVSGALQTYTSTPGVTSANFSVGDFCSGLGCTDENNCNYDPFASIYDQSACDQPCISFNFEYNEPMFELDWEFVLASCFLYINYYLTKLYTNYL